MIGHLATVYAVLPERHGVLVTFRDGSFTVDTERTFCRVLAPRAHPKGGSATELPEVGELGVVSELDGGFFVWLGGLHVQGEGENQIEPEAGATVHRDTAGIIQRSRANGDTEWMHPSGLRVTVSEDGLPLPALKHPGTPGTAKPPGLELEHPSGAKVTLAADGGLTFVGPSGAVISLTKDGNLEINACATVAFHGGASRFVMEALFDWAKTHKHKGVQGGSSVSGEPETLPPDASLSPDIFKGPHA